MFKFRIFHHKCTCQKRISYSVNNLMVLLGKTVKSYLRYKAIFCNKVALKGYLRYKTITSQNVSSEAQIKNFFI